jgi:double-stranded uracil-DNA glycosylase
MRRVTHPATSPSTRPTTQDLLAAADRTVPDVIAPNLNVLFCGINPGLYSAAVGHHFARPGNRFWPTLHRSGFTPRLLSPAEERELLPLGLGITNIADRASAAADELTEQELQEGGRRLRQKLKRYQPRVLAVLGVGAYRTAFAQKDVRLGRQLVPLARTSVWVMPNPSGLNAHYRLDRLTALFEGLRRSVEAGD